MPTPPEVAYFLAKESEDARFMQLDGSIVVNDEDGPYVVMLITEQWARRIRSELDALIRSGKLPTELLY